MDRLLYTTEKALSEQPSRQGDAAEETGEMVDTDIQLG